MRKIRTKSIRQKRRDEIIDKITLWAALIGSLVLLFSQLSMLPALRIGSIEVVGTHVLKEGDVGRAVQEHLDGHYLSLFDKTNMLLYPRGTIEESIRDTFPRVQDVHVETEERTRLFIDISERESVGRWCRDDACFLIDADGFIFARSTDTASSSHVFRGNLEGISDPIGRWFLFPEEFEQARVFIDFLDMKELAVQEFHVLQDIHYEAVLESGTRIILDPRKTYETMQKNLFFALEGEPLRDVNLETVDYIDVRFGNRIFFKEHEEEINIDEI